MPARTCRVGFTDVSGIFHAVDVVAESLYEAAILGICEFRKRDLLSEAWPGPATTLIVEVKASSAEHHVSLRHIKDWLGGVTRSPKEKATRERLRGMLGE